MRIVCLALSALLAAPALAAPPGDFARKGDFAVQQVATTDAAAFVRAWSAPSAATPPVTRFVAQGEQVDSFIVFTGCKPDLIRQCNVTADFALIGPQGQDYGRHDGAAIWVGKPPPPLQTLKLSDSSMATLIDPGDPAGDYIVRATVTDHVAHVSLVTEQRLTMKGTQ